MSGELMPALEKLLDHANHPAATGVPNRGGFEAVLELGQSRDRRFGTPSSVLVLDLDEHESGIDRMGRPAGHAVLRACAALLLEVSQLGDVTARVEDGEFALLAVATDLLGAHTLARWLRRQLSAAHVGASVGVATHRVGEDLSQTWQRARADNRVHELGDGHAKPIRSAQAGPIATRGRSDASSGPPLASRVDGLAPSGRGREGGEVAAPTFADVPQPELGKLTGQLTPETSDSSAAKCFARGRVPASAAASVLADHDRIAADLHEHVIQELSATGTGLQGMVPDLPHSDQQARLRGYIDALEATIGRLRTTNVQIQADGSNPHPDSPEQ